MDKSRIKEILEVYRPGEDLESDPEVRQALELAAKDPELAAWRQASEAFDTTFSAKLKDIQAPESLYERILANAPQEQNSSPPRETGKVIHWFHPAAFGAAAAIILFLALTFTFMRNPETDADWQVVREELMPTANSLYASLNPSFRSPDASQILGYLSSNGGVVPAALPKGFLFDKSFACDVINCGGKKVSLICFQSEDNTNKLHLFTFLRSEFPMVSLPSAEHPMLNPGKKGASAVWGDEEQIHVLFSDNGEEELRTVLDI